MEGKIAVLACPPQPTMAKGTVTPGLCTGERPATEVQGRRRRAMTLMNKLEIREAAQQFRDNGFVILRGALGTEELRLLQEETRAQIAAGPDREPRGDFMSKGGP